MLMQLHANRRDDVHAYTHLICAWLESNQGSPPIRRRAVADTGRVPSLR